ncbi:MAG: ThiF family adenylyltransferase [Thaumarchaeota archaeon]|nr:ThiF family adenylyltransferase [Nitrososphaerota archaeon]
MLQAKDQLSARELERYSRHVVLPEVGTEGQVRLKGSSVAIVGAGGLGVPAAVYLASAGVGRIGLFDADKVELVNLHRQFLYSEDDIGRGKVEVARKRLIEVNPNVNVDAHHVRLDSSNALTFLEGYGVVIDATDNLPSRYLVNDACVLLHKPDVYASVLAFEGQASVFFPPTGPCYRCLFPKPPPPESVRSCEDAGVLGVIPGIMGGLQASQAIGLLLGKGSPLIGRLLVFDGLQTSFDEVKVKRDEGCAVCGTSPSIPGLVDYEEFCGTRSRESVAFDIDPVELKASIDRGEKLVLVDVREPFEYEICRLKGSTLIPLGELPSRLGELDQDAELVVYCHTGVRSVTGTQFLRDSGYKKARNLKGGVDAWARLVDRKMRRY